MAIKEAKNSLTAKLVAGSDPTSTGSRPDACRHLKTLKRLSWEIPLGFTTDRLPFGLPDHVWILFLPAEPSNDIDFLTPSG